MKNQNREIPLNSGIDYYMSDIINLISLRSIDLKNHACLALFFSFLFFMNWKIFIQRQINYRGENRIASSLRISHGQGGQLP